MTFSLNTTDNSFTLTCTTTGGPATTVTWTRDSTTVTEGTETVLDDGTLSQFTHTLLVPERRAGLYRCMIANDVSNVSARLTVPGIENKCSCFPLALDITVMNVHSELPDIR